MQFVSLYEWAVELLLSFIIYLSIIVSAYYSVWYCGVAFYRGWYVGLVVQIFLCDTRWRHYWVSKFKPRIFRFSANVLRWLTCIGTDVFSVVIKGNVTVLHWLEVGLVIAFVSSWSMFQFTIQFGILIVVFKYFYHNIIVPDVKAFTLSFCSCTAVGLYRVVLICIPVGLGPMYYLANKSDLTNLGLVLWRIKIYKGVGLER